MRHLLNLIGNWFGFWLPLILCGGWVIGLIWGACWMIDTYGG